MNLSIGAFLGFLRFLFLPGSFTILYLSKTEVVRETSALASAKAPALPMQKRPFIFEFFQKWIEQELPELRFVNKTHVFPACDADPIIFGTDLGSPRSRHCVSQIVG
jgi:hypothetical protein